MKTPHYVNEVNGWLRGKLKEYNERPVEDISRHIDHLRDALEWADDDVVRPLFGGSVHKHTYVNGLSDIDVLMTVNDSSMSGMYPHDAIAYMENLISERLPRTDVSSGDMAVTVRYSDGIEIQLLPAIRRKDGVRIADAGANRWSAVVRPERFAKKLTEANQANKGNVIPTIKLVKGLQVGVIRNEKERISGYHMESLAIEAFQNYPGPHDLRSMVIHFCDFASSAALEPIRDSTGQSRHVDEDLGDAGSGLRKRAANHFRSMRNRFSRCESGDALDALFNGDDRDGGAPKPGGGLKRAGSASAGAVAASTERRFKPPSQYAAAQVRRGFDEVYDLTPLSATNVQRLHVNQPRMECDQTAGVIAGTLDMRAAWDPESGELVVNPQKATRWLIEDSCDLRIFLQYPARWIGDIPHRSPPVFEVGGRTRALAARTGTSLADLHMYPDGECCIGIDVAPPDRNHFDLARFVEIEIISWFYRFAYAERFGLERARRDLWNEYDHRRGPQQHIAFLQWIAAQKPKNNSPCPCESGIEYLRCHKRQIKAAKGAGALGIGRIKKGISRN